MKKYFLPIIAVFVVLNLVSCASGPGFAEVRSSLPPIPANQGRVFVYRPASYGYAIKPTVQIDGRAVGTSEARGFFYTDQPAGHHEITIATEWKHRNNLDVIPGRANYVECHATFGVVVAHVIPNQVDAATGEANIQDCKQTLK